MAENVVGVCASSHVIVTNCGAVVVSSSGFAVTAQWQAGGLQLWGEQV